MSGDNQWHLDKRVPLALIITIALQSVAAIWWAATTTTRLDNLEKLMTTLATQDQRVVRLEQQAITTTESLRRIETKLDRVIEREMQP